MSEDPGGIWGVGDTWGAAGGIWGASWGACEVFGGPGGSLTPPVPPQARSRGLQELLRGLGALEAHLSRGRPFLVGDSVTLADVTVACALLGPLTQVQRPPRAAGDPQSSPQNLCHYPQLPETPSVHVCPPMSL